MKFNDLVERLGVPARQVRFWIAEGIIPEALESGRYADAWDERHVRRGLQAAALQDRGFPPAALKILMDGGTAVPIATCGPVTLSIDPGTDPADIDVAATLAEIASALARYVRPQRTRPAETEE